MKPLRIPIHRLIGAAVAILFAAVVLIYLHRAVHRSFSANSLVQFVADNPAASSIQAKSLAALRTDSNLIVTPISQDNALLIRAQTDSPESAANLANQAARQFVSGATHGFTNDLSDRIGERTLDLQNQTAALHALVAQKAKLLAATGADDVHSLTDLQTTLDHQLQKRQGDLIQLASANSQVAHLAPIHLSDSPMSGDPRLQRDQLLQSKIHDDAVYQAALNDRAKATTDYQAQVAQGKTDEHRDVIIAKRTMQTAEAAISKREDELASAVDQQLLQSADAWLTSVKNAAHEQALRLSATVNFESDSIDYLRNRVARSIALRDQTSRIDAAIADARTTVDSLTRDVDQLRAAQAAAPSGQAKLLRFAQPPLVPDADRYTAMQCVAVLLAVLAGVTTSRVARRLDHHQRNRRRIEALFSAPVLASLPAIDSSIDAVLAGSAMANAFRRVRHQILTALPRGRNAICVTGCLRGDGGTTVAVGLAAALAKSGHRALLIDSDIRHGRVEDIFDLHSSGLVGLLKGEADWAMAVRQSAIPNLHILPAGTADANAADLINSPRFRLLLLAVRNLYDFVIIDSPPIIGAISHPASLADAVLCATDASNPRRDLHEAARLLRRQRTHIVGAVVNRSRSRSVRSHLLRASGHRRLAHTGPHLSTSSAAV